MTDSEILSFCKKATFSTLKEWHLARKHRCMLQGIERVYGTNESRAWLVGKLLLESDTEFRASRFEPHPEVLIPNNPI